jgi:chromodomain-helicase-DNA-binding protein 1
MSSSKGRRPARAQPIKAKKKSSTKSKKPSKPPPRVSRRSNLSESSDESSYSSEPVSRGRKQTRRAAAKVNYREVSDDDEENESKKKGRKAAEEVDHRPGQYPPGPEDGGECVEKVMDRRIGRLAATGACTTIYAIAKNGDPNSGFDAESGSPGEEQFLIKWQGWSHLHCTWESLRSLQEQAVSLFFLVVL